MNARDARTISDEVIAKKLRDAEQAASLEEERRRKDAERSLSAYPRFLRDVARRSISASASKGDKHTVITTRDEVIADLTVKKLIADGYDAHSFDVRVQECSYPVNCSHEPYTDHIIHVNWSLTDCPLCRERSHYYR